MAVASALLIRRVVWGANAKCDFVWIETFSVDRYRPMLRLLTDDDQPFLEATCRFSRHTIRKMRADRRRIFRAYLSNLIRDFNRMHYAARLVLLDAHVDRPELSMRIAQARFTFLKAVMLVHWRLLLHSAGVSVSSADVRRLLGSLDSMREDFSRLLPVQSGAY